MDLTPVGSVGSRVGFVNEWKYHVDQGALRWVLDPQPGCESVHPHPIRSWRPAELTASERSWCETRFLQSTLGEKRMP